MFWARLLNYSNRIKPEYLEISVTTEATMWSTGGSNKLHCLGGECGLHDWTQLMADEVHTYVCTVAKTVHRRDVIGQPGSADCLNTAWKGVS